LLENKFQCKVDVLNMEGIKPKVKSLIMEEMIYVVPEG
jgi:predicted nucleotidyltransferase